MQLQRSPWLVLAGIGLFLGPAAARAQPFRSDFRRAYVQIPFEGDLQRTLADQLLKEKGLEGFKALLDKIRQHPELLNLLPPGLTEMDLNNPERRPEIEKLLKELRKDLHLDPEDAKNLLHTLKEQAAKAAAAKADEKNDPAAALPPEQARPEKLPIPEEPAAPPVRPPSGDERLVRWARDMFKDTDRWEWDEMFRDSPALRAGLKDLQKLLADNEAVRRHMPSEGLARWAAGLRPSSGPVALPDLGWLKAKGLSLPSLSRPNLRLPRLGLGAGMPRLALGLPRLGMPGGGGRGLGQGVLWVAVLGLAALVLWQLVRQWSGLRARRAGAAWQPGPWPVDPAKVATRAELIQAFEYLSLLRLGPDARSWNHRAIAAHLPGQDRTAARGQAADELASLYEQARYTPATDPLPTEAMASARRDLCLLAGVASA